MNMGVMEKLLQNVTIVKKRNSEWKNPSEHSSKEPHKRDKKDMQAIYQSDPLGGLQDTGLLIAAHEMIGI